MSTVVLFGATGFLGRQVRLLLSEDPRADRLVCPGRAELDLLAATPADVAGLLRFTRPSVVVNCVGRMSGGHDELLRGNAGVTALLLDAIAAVAPGARYVRLGSAAEYGPGEPGRSQHEDDPARPTSPYGISHLAGTLMVEQAGAVDGVSLRLFNLVGPGVSTENVLGRARELLRTASGHLDLGPLGAMRDFVDVRDVADAVVRAAFARELPARVINVGSGRAVPVREAVTLLTAVAGFTGEVRESAPEHSRSRAVSWSQADIGRAWRVLGWRAGTPLADSVKAMV
ncbi:NAD-dependent epimerase/dehydratase family protein [Nonomuraea jiangxiensis]|uniref:Nucleoside-diphosphate-sugar epimerase n=1 Tax=Nonomuraea jiangxiensis TaxID=633440 RepID=A0A1G8MDH1_9ACTN|nr:NAD-dependent epimerase/dehydratase family protein [Nonomuraea jiangxiensis]SDI65954.1 Nucleoside-diphosphate-sugar epimerase [Nonomuraea jiangxiensis]